jgi:hypothetical protein
VSTIFFFAYTDNNSPGHYPLIIRNMPDIIVNESLDIPGGDRGASDGCRILLTGGYDIVTIIDGLSIVPQPFVEVPP